MSDLRALLVLALVAAAVAAGCGGSSADDNRSAADVKVAYTELQRSFAARDGARVCRLISGAAQRQVGSLGHASPTTCVRDIRQLFHWMGKAAEREPLPAIESVSVDGDKATVAARLDGGAPGRVRFVDERGGWKLDDFFGVTGPPPADMR